jgi:predicted DNA-binding protein (MmcQ/YjbR family)
MDQTASKRTCHWPGVTCDINWGGDLVGSVGGGMYCCLRLDDAGPDPLTFRVEDERFLELTDRPGFRPAPYLARVG